MSAEERWTQQREWAEEARADMEIKAVTDIEPDAVLIVCFKYHCPNRATKIYEVGPESQRGGTEFALCGDHADDDVAITLGWGTQS